VDHGPRQRQTKDFGHTHGDKYSCLVYDNRGIGDSDKPRARYSTSEMAKDVIEVVDHLGWTDKRQLHVIGISMGGMIAQEVVSRSVFTYIKYRATSASSSNAFGRDNLYMRSRKLYLPPQRLAETGPDRRQTST
jgi:alpha-beta hydrolase superfamily lysophospholipase